MKKYQYPRAKQDSSYGHPLEADICTLELKRVCSEYLRGSPLTRLKQMKSQGEQ